MNYKEAIEILERMTAEPEDGREARLDADELDAVLLAINGLKDPAYTRGRIDERNEIETCLFVDEYYEIGTKEVDIENRNTSFTLKDTHGNEREFVAVDIAAWISARGHRDEDGELYNPSGLLCSNCKTWHIERTRFCPHCGADMD